MNRNRRLKLAALAAVVLLVAASAVAWRSVAAQPGDDPPAGRGEPGNPGREAAPALAAPVPGGPTFYSQRAIAFHPYASTMSWAFWDAELYNPGGTDLDAEASLSLPNGATITKLVAYYFDACGSRDVRVELRRDDSAGDLGDVLAWVQSSDNVNGYRYAEDSTIDFPVVDQQRYSYRAVALIPQGCDSNLSLNSIRIDYGFGVNLPLVRKNQ